MEFHVVTNGKLGFDEIIRFMKIAGSKIDYLHIREKEKTAMDIYEGVRSLIASGIPAEKLIMNDRADIAWAVGLTRVQLGYKSLSPSAVKSAVPDIHAGQSIHSLEEAMIAEKSGADSVLFGHLFETGSKKGLLPKGIESAKRLACRLSIDVLVIGGIKPMHIQTLSEGKIAGFAVMSGIWESSSPISAVEEYRNAITACKEARL
ncbi:thiamine phosphate synthase [Metabacillus sp. KIGAM252]|uniref:Thiamine phosphate synthase n=1 Tax=Metabacillus flavus TaxID=2823519 RepID=A0ABS5LI24_9BACI|nr:thiamine phosphate synthase [Metabacillus flavus]MBS2970266.1 thiamine phosphate synthase [Metabacillus flavus]